MGLLVCRRNVYRWNWDAVVNSPLGEQRSALTLKAEDGIITGETVAPNETPVPLLNGKWNGDTAGWTVAVTKPMKMNVDLEATLVDNKPDCFAKPAAFGRLKFKAARRA